MKDPGVTGVNASGDKAINFFGKTKFLTVLLVLVIGAAAFTKLGFVTGGFLDYYYIGVIAALGLIGIVIGFWIGADVEQLHRGSSENLWWLLTLGLIFANAFMIAGIFGFSDLVSLFNGADGVYLFGGDVAISMLPLTYASEGFAMIKTGTLNLQSVLSLLFAIEGVFTLLLGSILAIVHISPHEGDDHDARNIVHEKAVNFYDNTAWMILSIDAFLVLSLIGRIPFINTASTPFFYFYLVVLLIMSYITTTKSGDAVRRAESSYDQTGHDIDWADAIMSLFYIVFGYFSLVFGSKIFAVLSGDENFHTGTRLVFEKIFSLHPKADAFVLGFFSWYLVRIFKVLMMMVTKFLKAIFKGLKKNSAKKKKKKAVAPAPAVEPVAGE